MLDINILTIKYATLLYFSEPYAAFTKSPGSFYGMKMGKMISPKVPAHSTGQKRCFVFHYQLNGRDFPTPSTLSVYLQYDKTDGKGKEYVNSFAVSGHQGNFWRRKAITINEVNHPYEVRKMVSKKSKNKKFKIQIENYHRMNRQVTGYL